MFRIVVVAIFTIAVAIVATAEEDGGSCPVDVATAVVPPPSSSITESIISSSPHCRLFLAPRRDIEDDEYDDEYYAADIGTRMRHGRKLGLYYAGKRPLSRGTAVSPPGGDVLFHLIDVTLDVENDNDREENSAGSHLSHIQYSQLAKWREYGYIVNSRTSGYGGNYEGLGDVYTALSGIGALSSSYSFSPSSSSSNTITSSLSSSSSSSRSVKTPNAWAPMHEIDESGLSRYDSPLAGSFTLHHNQTYFVTSRDGMMDGTEILVDRYGDWFRNDASMKGRDRRMDEGEVGGEGRATKKEGEATTDDRLILIREKGACIDDVHYDISPHGFGRGVIASRALRAGSIVMPVPVLPLPRNEVMYLRHEERKRAMRWYQQKRRRRDDVSTTTMATGESGGADDDDDDDDGDENMPELPPGMRWREQLLLNYCFGHVNSSVLLFPYGHANYVNHAPSSISSSSSSNVRDDNANGGGTGGGVTGKRPVANVGLRWSEKLTRMDGNGDAAGGGDAGVDPRSLPPPELMGRSNPEGLVLEMFALADIRQNEEVLFDYGDIWSRAWEEHVRNWNDHVGTAAYDGVGSSRDYSPAYVMDDVVSTLRTAEEQVNFPYPDNVFTACFYRYHARDDGYDRNEEESKGDEGTESRQSTISATHPGRRGGTTTESHPWRMTPGLFDMINLRPCKVVSREAVVDRRAAGGGTSTVYTAIVQNRPGLPHNERIPRGERHVVSGIPRGAFRFVDRPYTSDAHLDWAFRQNIGLEGTGLYPEIWLDLD